MATVMRIPTLSGVAMAMVMLSAGLASVSGLEPETCFSRQHRQATVNVRLASSRPGTVIDSRIVNSERDCILACCSEEVAPGAKCNMAVFKAKKPAASDNCLLFHCDTEQDCPLMMAGDGVNTYDIFKGNRGNVHGPSSPSL
ncbi:MANSC domain-containing protein 1 [Gadus chalcogrammus]|uniref:MANSC domain-containing protein 1 n=1 Tax=Gadus chalcogrammus TaxID=1042646 RepID=UPI0024C419AB|nr:MANSC domain-containing protein 1 [Gadus chalcogrammus]